MENNQANEKKSRLQKQIQSGIHWIIFKRSNPFFPLQQSFYLQMSISSKSNRDVSENVYREFMIKKFHKFAQTIVILISIVFAVSVRGADMIDTNRVREIAAMLPDKPAGFGWPI